MRKRHVASIAALMAIVLSSCSSYELTNEGSKTRCEDFNRQSAPDQAVTITKDLKQEKISENPTKVEVDVGIAAATAFCVRAGNKDTTIGEVHSAGLAPSVIPSLTNLLPTPPPAP